MMKKIIEQYFCDLCGKQAEVEVLNYPVIFHTEQTEGRSTEPYIRNERIEACQECIKKVLVLHGYGAQGLNRYEIRPPKED